MKPESINQISLPEAMELLAGINHNPAWTSEQLMDAVAHFPDQKLMRILAALEVVGTASSYRKYARQQASSSLPVF